MRHIFYSALNAPADRQPSFVLLMKRVAIITESQHYQYILNVNFCLISYDKKTACMHAPS